MLGSLGDKLDVLGGPGKVLFQSRLLFLKCQSALTCKCFAADLVPEKPPIIPTNRPAASWPERGAITVQNLTVRYRPELDPVIKGISFSIKPMVQH